MSDTKYKFGRATALAVAVAAAPLLAGLSTSQETSAAVANHEITITITKVKAIDQIDAFSKGDFYARASIGKDVQTTPVAKQQAEIQPNWKLSYKVPPGKHTLKLEILDKDLTADDPIDVNPLDKNRVLEATIDTRRCRISGYGKSYRCGAKVTTTGREKKAAEVTFIVDVKK